MKSQPRKGIAHRIGRWSARHRKLAIWGWLGFVVVSFAIGTIIGTKTIDPKTSGPGEAGRMAEIVATEFEQPAGEVVLVQSDELTVRAPAFSAAIAAAIEALEQQPAVTNLRPPLAANGQISQDRHAAMIRSTSAEIPTTRSRRSTPSSPRPIAYRSPIQTSSSGSSVVRAETRSSTGSSTATSKRPGSSHCR